MKDFFPREVRFQNLKIAAKNTPETIFQSRVGAQRGAREGTGHCSARQKSLSTVVHQTWFADSSGVRARSAFVTMRASLRFSSSPITLQIVRKNRYLHTRRGWTVFRAGRGSVPAENLVKCR